MGHICEMAPSTTCCMARALLWPLQRIITSSALITVAIPTVRASLGTLLTSLSKKRELAMMVSVVRVLRRVREEKLEVELRARQQELVSSRMNVVRKNEMLLDIKKTAVSLNNALPSSTEIKKSELLTTIKRRVMRLISQIDTNIEHDEDLEAFKDTFDSVHHHFLQTLDERYPSLSHKEKMLCVYIRMNLLSKEIAPLLNISTRGVEISRYRIRQKLGLDSKDSLTKFLQSL